jgi:ribonucleoside-diphosphate reductase beta chain
MLLDHRHTYKPFMYPWAFEAFEQHEQMHWTKDEVSLNKDIENWRTDLSDGQREFLTQIFRFFTTGDQQVEVAYNKYYLPLFHGNPEVAMMLNSFAAREATHTAAYAMLVDSLGLPESEYSAFLNYKVMADKYDYLEAVDTSSHLNMAKSIAIYSAFTEGLMLFSSFVMLMHFERCGMMSGMTNIVRWSWRDETAHTENLIKLFREFKREYLGTEHDVTLEAEIQDICRKMVELEDAFIDQAFEVCKGEINHGLRKGEKPLTSEDVKMYIKHTADIRLKSLGFAPIYGEPKNPLTWVEELIMAPEHANFFEVRPTEYSKGKLELDDGGY